MVKFLIERDGLLKSLAHVQSVVERRQTIPILSNVLIEASTQNGGMLSLQATDNEIEISDKVQAQVENEGNLTVSAHKLYDIVKKLPDGAQVECTSYWLRPGGLGFVCRRFRQRASRQWKWKIRRLCLR
mgnify:CR=1 FL=1